MTDSNLKFKLFKSQQIKSCSDLKESKNFFIARSPRKIFFLDKVNLKISKVFELETDNEFGYKKICVYNDICYTIVHQDYDDANPAFGKGESAYLQAYDKDHRLWSFKLTGWTTGANYGGFGIVSNKIVIVIESNGGQNELLELNLKTGELIDTIPFKRVLHSGNNVVNNTTLIAGEDRIYFGTAEEGLFCSQMKEGKFNTQLLSPLRLKSLTENNQVIYAYGLLGDQDVIQTFNKNGNLKECDVVLKFDGISPLEEIYSLPAKDQVILLHKDYSISYLNLGDNTLKWTIGNEPNEEIFQVRYLSEDYLLTLWVEPTACFRVIEIKTGTVLYELQNDDFMEPFFIANDLLFCNSFFELVCYKMTR